MRIWYDMEFLEDGKTIEPISIGMVAEDDRQLYFVNEEIIRHPLYDRIRNHEWLMKNVIPQLPLVDRAPDGQPSMKYVGPGSSMNTSYFRLNTDSVEVMPLHVIRKYVKQFVKDTPDPELWAWYGSYDFVALVQLVAGRMIDLPEGFPRYSNELKQEVNKKPFTPREHYPLKHNALFDALHNRRTHLQLEVLKDG